MAARAAAPDADYFKSLPPSQLVAERGEEIVVINPGSTNLRVGLASHQKGPVQVPHCIARYWHGLLRSKSPKDESRGTQARHSRDSSERLKLDDNHTNAVRDDSFQKNPVTGSRAAAREATLNEVEEVLKIAPTVPVKENKDEEAEESYTEEPEEDDVDFSWTDVMWSPPSAAPASRKRKSEGSDDENSDERERNRRINSPREREGSPGAGSGLKDRPADDGVHKGEVDEIGEEKGATLAEKGGVESFGRGREGDDVKRETNGRELEKEGRKWEYRPFICGEDALTISSSEPYVLRRPILRGRLNISQRYSIQQVCDDLAAIWGWAISDKLGLGLVQRRELSVVLVVPDTLDNRELKEMVAVVLRDLEFQSVVIHQESLAATFGNGISSACVVNLGGQVTSVVCIEDGVVLPASRIILPYGGEDISRCLLWLQERNASWPYKECDPLRDPLDRELIGHLKECYCQFLDEEQEDNAEFRVRRLGQPTKVYNVTLCGINVAPMGFFYPALLALEECSPYPRQCYHLDYEDVLDESPLTDIAKEAIKKAAEGTDMAAGGGGQGGIATGQGEGGEGEGEGEREGEESLEKEEVRRKGVEPTLMGVHQAIVTSILRVDREDIQKKLFTNIQLVGGCSLTSGIVDVLEERVLHSIPLNVSVDTVEVLPCKNNPCQTVVWKGGAIMGVLDFARDAWVQREDFCEGGVRVGSGRKYKDSLSMQSQIFWYSALVE